MVFHSQAKNGGNVLAPVFEYHLCIFVHHEVHEGREEKSEMPGTAGPDFYDTSALFMLFATFVVQPGFSPKLRERDNQTRCGQIEIKNIHDNLTVDFDN